MNPSATGLAQQVDSLLDAVTPAARLTDEVLRDLLVECEQAIAMLQAIQADTMVQMGVRAEAADRAEVADRGEPLWSQQSRAEFVADEIGVLLGCTKMAASIRYGTARQAAQFPTVGLAWRSGLLDVRKVTTICEQISHLERGDADRLAVAAVDYATQPGRSRTAPQVREWLRRRVIAADPEAAEARRQHAMADRRVVITPGDDGMSELWALLPSIQARQIQQALTATAQQLSTDDARTMDQRRADTLVDLLLGRTQPAAVDLQVIVPAATITGTCQQPGWVPGLGPVTAPEVGELIGTGTGCDGHGTGTGTGTGIGSHVSMRRLLADPATGVLTDVAEKRYRPSAALDRAVRARDVTCRFPGCRRAADSPGTDLDHTIPWPQGPTTAANLAVLCRRHHRLKHTTGWTVTLQPDGVMTWTTPTGRQFHTEPWRYTNPHPPPLQ